MKTTTHDGTEIHYQTRGSGAPLLLIHGFSASSRMWPAAMLDRLSEDFQVITFDARGTGESSVPTAAYTATDLATDASAVLDAAKVQSALVLGYSMGGMIAQQLALDHAARVRALVLACTASGGPGTVLNGELMGPLFAGGDPRDAVRRFWSGIAAPGYGDANPQVLDGIADAAMSAPTPPQTLAAQGEALQAFDATPRLGELSVPTRVLHGRADPLNRFDNAERLASAIAGAELTLLDGVGHLLPWEAPSAIPAAIGAVAA